MKTFSLFVLLSFSFIALPKINALEYTPVRSGVEYAYIGTYDIERLQAVFSTELDAFLGGSTMPAGDFEGQFDEPLYPVRLYRVKYRSVIPEFDNRPTIASGLIAIPESEAETFPLISYQHGTVLGKEEVPSNPDESMETRMMIAQFASRGYVLIAADYFGMGDSEEPNSYLVRRSSEQACVDMLFAARDMLESMEIGTDNFFIHGWSQGGWTTLTYLRKLEQLGIKVTAAATASGPPDVAVTINRWLNNPQPIDAVYLPSVTSNFIFALEHYKRMPGLTRQAIRPQYLELARDLYEFKIDADTFMAQTPAKMQEYFTEDFRKTGYLAESRFWRILDEQEQAYRWICQTPLRTFYGGADEVVPVLIAKLAETFHKILGAKDTRAIDAGVKADHRATYAYSVIHAKAWFDRFRDR